MATAGRVKALALCQNLRVGGAEELILGASTHLPGEGVETGVVTITSRGSVADEIAEAGVPVHLVPGEPGPRDPAAFARLVRLLQRERPDVVHTYLLNACLYGRLAAIVAGVPAILAAEQNVYRQKSKRHIAMERLLAIRTYRVVACCRTVGDFYRRQVGVPAQKIAVVYNAVKFGPEPTQTDRTMARRRLGVPDDALVIGTVGRLTEQKGLRVLLEAIASLAPRLSTLLLLLAGDGPLRGDLENDVATLGIQDRVRFLGIRRDRETLYSAMDVFALPSLWEGLSLALVEAMGAGCAVVATAVGGNPEIVEHQRTGLLAPAGDAVSLTDALATLAADAGSRDALGAAAAIEARSRFSIEQHVSEIARLYREGLAERQRARRTAAKATV